MKELASIEVIEQKSFLYAARQSYIDNTFKMYYY